MSGLLLLLPMLLGFADGPNPEVPNTEKAPIPFLTPAESLKALKLPDGFTATMFAHEPDVRNPIGIATDERGRLWVAENYSYAEASLGWDDKLKDRVIILEDTDGDGKADKRKVFWDQGRRLTSVELGYGGVWVLDAPKLLFIPDKNRDDVPDGEPIVMLDGWNDAAIRHNIVNGLRWGPDGWLYGRHGILQTSLVGRPGATADQRTPMNVGLWRFHPTRHTFEVVCNGTTNPWGMDWDENGELFFINTVIGHLWHAIPGAYLQRMYGEHLNPNVYQSIQQTADHFHWDTVENWSDIRKIGVSPTTDKAGGGHAHSGLLFVHPNPTMNWPEKYGHSVLTVNLHGHRLNRDTVHREGATYVAKHAEDFAASSDPYFRAVDLIFGRSGEVYLADWSDVGECHENDGVHRSSGRIFQLHYDKTWVKKPIKDTLHSLDSKTASGMLGYNDQCANSLIQRVLLERLANGRDVEVIKQALLERLTAGDQPERRRSNEQSAAMAQIHRLNGLWSLRTLHAAGFTTESLLAKYLTNEDEHHRVTSIQLLVDGPTPSDSLLAQMAAIATSDKSGLVLTYLASALQKLPHEKRWAIAKGLAAHGELVNDRVFPLMLWYGIEAAVPAQPDEAVKLAGESKIPLILEFIARRLASNIERAPEPVAKLVELLRKDKEPDSESQATLLKGIATGLKGWRKAPAPSNWTAVSALLAKSKNSEVQTLTRELSLVFGDGRALDELRTIAANDGATPDERRAAVRALVVARDAQLVPTLQKLVGHRELAIDAIRGLAAFDHPDTSALLVGRFNGLLAPARREAVDTLISRKKSAVALLAAVESSKIHRDEVSAFQLRQMLSYGDTAISQQVGKLWPELAQVSQEKAAIIAAMRTKLTPETLAKGDASAGRLLFSKSCMNCHTLFGEGKKLAPDLTGAQRSNLNYLLENIVDPSLTVSENFRMSIVLLNDGRVLNGVIVERGEKTLTLQTATERIALQKEDIEEQRDSKLSMMPDNLLSPLKDDQIRDLILYLMSPSQVPLAGEK